VSRKSTCRSGTWSGSSEAFEFDDACPETIGEFEFDDED
jgi:hypothetical protein